MLVPYMFINPTANIPLACSDRSHLHVNGITLQFSVGEKQPLAGVP